MAKLLLSTFGDIFSQIGIRAALTFHRNNYPTVKGLQSVAARHLRGAIIVFLSHIKCRMSKDIPDDSNMCRVKLGDGRCDDMAECMGPQWKTKVRLRKFPEHAREALIGETFSVLIDPKPGPIVFAQQDRSVDV